MSAPEHDKYISLPHKDCANSINKEFIIFAAS